MTTRRPTRHTTRRRRRGPLTAAGALTVAALLAACSSGADPTVDPGTQEGAVSQPSSALSAACGPDLVVQLPWWPGVDYAFLFELIDQGAGDPDDNTYTGQVGQTGVSLELRSGGPAAGFQSAQSLIYQDDAIDFIVGSAADQVSASVGQPTVSVFSYYDVYPVIFVWGDPEWDFQSLAEVKDAGVPILGYGSGAYLTALEQNGVIDPAQVDPSFDGSPARFVTENGAILQQDYITTAPYTFEHVVEAWGKPIDFLSINSEFPIYGTTFQARTDRLADQADCLSELVPLIQQAAIDYALDPAGTNAALIAYTDQLAGIGASITVDSLSAANAAQLKYGLVRNSPDGTFGSFDDIRVRKGLDLLVPALVEAGLEIDQDSAPDELFTNRFLDPSISLPDDVPVPANTLPDDVPGL